MVHNKEIQWMLRQRPLVHDPDQLRLDYGAESLNMLAMFRDGRRERYLPLLAWPGIATRWQTFVSWLDLARPSGDLVAVFSAFALHLGRMTSYRALALTPDQYAAIRQADSILPSGRLKADADTLAHFVRREGVRKILHTRMCKIGTSPYDPSLSLHDYPETAVCIAEGYMKAPSRPIYRLELDVPAIEVIGWRMSDVGGLERWFEHRGVWFDTTNPRTERFMLFEIPWFSERCKSLRIFATPEEVKDYLLPFAEDQIRRRTSSQSQRVG